MIELGVIAAAAVSAARPAAQGAWILTCNIGRSSEVHADPSVQRVFRIGPQLFQEWNPAEKQFGPNLCQSFTCKGDASRMEGTISSASLTLTVSLDLATGRGAWRTQGASQLGATSGPCSVQPPDAGDGATPRS